MESSDNTENKPDQTFEDQIFETGDESDNKPDQIFEIGESENKPDQIFGTGAEDQIETGDESTESEDQTFDTDESEDQDEPTEPTELQNCPACQELPIMTIGFSSCTHIMCSGCLDKLAETHRQNIPCPLCRVPFDGFTMKEDIDVQVRERVGEVIYAEMIALRSQENSEHLRNRLEQNRVRVNRVNPNPIDNIFGPPPPRQQIPTNNPPRRPFQFPTNDRFQFPTNINTIMPMLIPLIPQIIQGLKDFTESKKLIFKISKSLRLFMIFLQMISFIFICSSAVSTDPNKYFTIFFVIMFGTGHIIRNEIYELNDNLFSFIFS